MKKHVDFVPRSDADFLSWLIVYRNNFPRLVAGISGRVYTPAETEQHLQAIDDLIEAFYDVVRQQATLSAVITRKNLLRKKVTKQIRYVAMCAKKSQQPLTEMVTSLHLISRGQPVDTSIAAPSIKARTSVEGVHLYFDKQRFLCVAIFSRYSGESGWTFLGNCIRSPFIDKRPLRMPRQPEIREYMVMYSNGEKMIGQESDIVSIVYGG
jgi:hypothetical protein